MTTEDKLKALGFKRSVFKNNSYYKLISLKDAIIKIFFDFDNNAGTIRNLQANAYEKIKNFNELLRLNDFYEKQSKRAISRHESRNDSETQNDIQRAY